MERDRSPAPSTQSFDFIKNAGTDRFKPDRSYVEETILPSVRAPHEGASCLRRLAAITLAARPL